MFQAHQPSRQLQPYIQCYLEADYKNSLEKGEHTLFPNGLSGIFFNFGNMGKLIIKEEYKTPFVSVFGQIDRHFSILHWPGFYSLGVLMRPTVLSKLLRVDMAEFTNKAFEGNLIRQDFSFLYQQLEEVNSIKKKITLIEHFFSKALAGIDNRLTITDKALHQLSLHGNIPISKLSHHLGISDRYLEMNFKRSVGLSPKTYSLILRFKRIEQQLKNSCVPSWKDLSFVNEFHDQNHFIKDFKRFTGMNPSAYLLNNVEMGRSYLAAH